MAVRTGFAAERTDEPNALLGEGLGVRLGDHPVVTDEDHLLDTECP